MTDITKLDMSFIWASGGDKVAPTNAKIAQGWIVEAVPRQTWNWFENRQDQNIAYLLQKGIPEWDNTTEYQINKSFVQRSGIVYRCLATNTNQDPVSASTYWKKAFADASVTLDSLSGITQAANTLAYFDSTTTASTTAITAFARSFLASATATAARTVLGAQASSQNLTALSGVTAASNALPYFDSNTTMTTTLLGTTGRSILASADQASARAALGLNNGSTSPVGTTAGTIAAGDDSRIVGAAQKSANLSDLTNIVTARTNLGLSSVATASLTTSRVDNNTGRIVKVGDFGVGTDGVPVGDINALLPASATGFYKLITPFTGSPIASAPATVQHTVYDNQATQYASYEGAATPRLFVRKYSSGAWQAWVEVYHSGNSSALVSQVTANVQPTLDTKVNKAGDSMTGTLYGTNSTSAFQANGTTPKIELHKPGLAAYMWWINANNNLTLASTNGAGVASAELMTVNSVGTMNISGDFSAGGITGRGAITASGGLTTNGGLVQVQAASASANAHVYFRNNTGSERALIYSDSSGGIHLRSNGGPDTVIMDSSRGVTMSGNVAIQNTLSVASSLGVTGGISTAAALYAAGAITSATALYAGGAFVDTNGNLYGAAWSGYLSTYLTNNFITPGNIGQNMANQGTGSIGSYAYLGNTSGSTIGPGGLLSGGLNYASNGSNGGGAAAGTWRAMGYGVNGQFTVWQRVA